MLAARTVLVTGLPSPGKVRLVAALAGRLRDANIDVRLGRHARSDADPSVLHVHAQSDIEALVEGELPDDQSPKGAQVVVAVDWEPVDRSVRRVIATLGTSGVHTPSAAGS